MLGRQRTPVDYLVPAILGAILLLIAITLLATGQRWLGLALTPAGETGARVVAAAGPAAAIPAGTVLTGIGGGGDRVGFIASDFTVEPDGSIGSYRAYDDFLARQERMAAIKELPEVDLFAADGRSWRVSPDSGRPVISLPVEYWVQLFVGLFAWVIAVSIWAFRRGELSARYLLLSGFSTLVFAPTAAVYGTREIALHPVPFEILDSVNFLGGSLFIAALVALLLYYPRQIAPRWAGVAIVAVYVLWYVAQELGVVASMTMARRVLVMVGILATFALATAQWRLTRTDPIARAALQWFLLSWLLGITIFASMLFVPQMLGIDTSDLQPFGFVLFLLVYGGLAFGIIRYRLFELGEWWVRVMVWAASIVALVLLDLLFLLGLGLSSELSLGLSLLICGLIWLPLRGWLWGRLVARSSVDAGGRFKRLVEAAFRPGAEDRRRAWSVLLDDVFEPLTQAPLQSDIAEAAIAEDGLALLVPAAGDVPPLRLDYARRGRRLFTRADLALADELSDMFDHLIRNRAAYETGVATERRRIASDIHDNVGASLMGALHSADAARKDRLIRDTLADLRGIINGANAEEMSVGDALGQMRREVAERLGSAIRLDWAHVDSPARLSPDQVHAIRAVIREAVSNTIRHSGATMLAVRAACKDGRLTLLIEDDGRGFDISAPGPGNGLSNIRRRVTDLGGALDWRDRRPGTMLSIDVPIGG